jgi:hypothetical protein
MTDGTMITFAPSNPSTSVSPYSINDLGDITGTSQDPSGQCHGFIRRRDGTFVTFDLPGVTFILSFSINNSGELTGYYQESVYTTAHGYLRMP